MAGPMDPPPPPVPPSDAAAAAAPASSSTADSSIPPAAPNQDQTTAWSEEGPWSAWGVLGKQKKAVSALRFSHDGKLLATASADPTIAVYNMDNTGRNTTGGNNSKKRDRVCMELAGHTHGVSDVAWARDSRLLASASDDKSVRLWDTETGQEVSRFLGHGGYIFCLAIDGGGSLIASGAADESVRIWDIRSGGSAVAAVGEGQPGAGAGGAGGGCLRTLSAHSEPVTALDFSPDGSCLASSSYDGVIRVWDVGMGQCLKTLFADGSPAVSHVRFSPSGRHLLAGFLDSALRLWSVESPSKCVRTYRGHVNERLCLSSALALYGPHQHVVSGSEDGGLCVWDLQSKRPLQRLSGHADALLALAKHPTEALLATGGTSKDCSIRLWRIRELAPSFAGEQEEEKEEEGGQQQEAAVAAPVAVESAVAEEAGGVAMDQSA